MQVGAERCTGDRARITPAWFWLCTFEVFYFTGIRSGGVAGVQVKISGGVFGTVDFAGTVTSYRPVAVLRVAARTGTPLGTVAPLVSIAAICDLPLGLSCAALVSADGSGNWSFTPSTPLADGTVVNATATDPAGNTGGQGSTTVDAIAPATPTVNLSNGSNLSGTAEPGSTVMFVAEYSIQLSYECVSVLFPATCR